MMDAGRHAGRSGSGRWARGVAAWLTVGLICGLLLFGCGAPQSPGGNQAAQDSAAPPDPSGRDPHATTVAIDDSGDVDLGTVTLSKQAGNRIQWWNKSSDTLLIILKDSHISELILPHRFSSSFRVCIDCDTGYYHYDIKRMVTGKPKNPKSGPPGEPQVGVGD